MNKIYIGIKYSLDFLLALALTAALSPVMLAIAAAIKAEDGGPAIFSQWRTGAGGRKFRCYKFRSMKSTDVSYDKHKRVIKDNNPNLTKVGRFIRKTSIDELPQFWNILKGEMSLVGTRPPTEEEFLQYEGYHRRRLSATPGLTGLWQVSGRSHTMLPSVDMIGIDSTA